MKQILIDRFYNIYLIHVFIRYLFKRRIIVRNINNKNYVETTIINQNNLVKDNKIFILGSGSSINDYTNKEWNEISSNHSFGFNHWFYHKFTPNYYSLEVLADSLLWKKQFSEFSKVHNAYKDVPIMIRGAIYRNIDLSILNKDLKWFLPLELEAPIKSYKQLRKALKLFKFLSRFKYVNRKIVLGSNASVVAIIFTAWRMGYKEIILCGVDLNNLEYFDSRARFSNDNVINNTNYKKNSNKLHKTARFDGGLLPVQEIIYAINEHLMIPLNIKLYVAKSSSLLSEKIPVYFEI